MVLAQTIVDAPNQGARRRAAAISAPRLAAPTTKTTASIGGPERRDVTTLRLPVGPPCGRVRIDPPFGGLGPAGGCAVARRAYARSHGASRRTGSADPRARPLPSGGPPASGAACQPGPAARSAREPATGPACRRAGGADAVDDRRLSLRQSLPRRSSAAGRRRPSRGARGARGALPRFIAREAAIAVSSVAAPDASRRAARALPCGSGIAS